MTASRLDEYRRLIDLHTRNSDPLVMIRVDDLRALIEIAEKPKRVRVKAESAECSTTS